LQRLVLMVMTFVAITMVSFSIVHLAPGDPVELFFAGGLDSASGGVESERLENVEKAKRELRAQPGLDRSLPGQYACWLARIGTGDLGRSFKDTRPVLEKIGERIPLTVTISGLAILITFLIAIPIGIFSAVKTGSAVDRALTVLLYVLYSLPGFWIGTLII